MNRREFLKAVAGAVAAAGMPSVVVQAAPIKAELVGPRWVGALGRLCTVGAKWVVDGKLYGEAWQISRSVAEDSAVLAQMKSIIETSISEKTGRNVVWTQGGEHAFASRSYEDGIRSTYSGDPPTERTRNA